MCENWNISWNPVTYNPLNQHLPPQRWGHNFLKLNEKQLLMFGGYGGTQIEGMYLDDLWCFDLIESTWNRVQTSGDLPEARSNYTIHFHEESQRVIMFGGGSYKKQRFNSVCILDWNTKVWSKIMPKQSEPSPWERTYHTSELLFPFLVIFGGQSSINVDLNDMWVFNLQTHQWKELQFEQNGITPSRRRFHSSVLLDSCFYVIGGCSGPNYSLHREAYRVNLAKLISQSAPTGYKWECLLEDCHELQRWGHTSNIFNGKIVITCGRISQTQDSNETFIFDPQTAKIQPYQDGCKGGPIARRRHASAIVGNSLLIYGGFNGSYLQNFTYLNLKNIAKKPKSTVKIQIFESTQEMMRKLSMLLEQQKSDVIVTVRNKQTVLRLRSTKAELSQNSFFRNVIKYSDNQTELVIDLPKDLELLTFRWVHFLLMRNQLPLARDFDHFFYEELLKIMEYFCCLEVYPAIEKILIEKLTTENCRYLYSLSFDFELTQLEQEAGKLCLRLSKKSFSDCSKIEQAQTMDHIHSEVREHPSIPQFEDRTKHRLSKLYSKIKFDLYQAKLREETETIFSKAANRFKSIISGSPPINDSQWREEGKKNEQKNCWNSLIGCLRGILNRPKIRPQYSV